VEQLLRHLLIERQKDSAKLRFSQSRLPGTVVHDQLSCVFAEVDTRRTAPLEVVTHVAM